MESKQVLSIEQMQHLQELGLVTSKASMCWRRKTRDFRGEEKIGRWSLVINQPIIVSNFETYEEVPAFTLQDVLELLPHIDGCQLSLGIDCDPKMVWYEDIRNLDESNYPYDRTICFTGDTMLDAAYKALVWAVKAGCLKTDKRKQL